MRIKKAFRNLIFNILQQFVNILVNFLMPPIIVSSYGSTINGLVSTIRQIMQYIQLTGAGIAQASTIAMYKPLAEKNEKELSGIYNATRNMFSKAGNIFSIITLIVAIIYPFFVKEQINYLTVFFLIIVIGISGASEFYFCGKYNALLNANQENYFVAIAQTFGSITNLIFLIFLTKLKQNIIIVQLGMSCTYILRIILLTFYVRKKYPYIDLNEKPAYEKINQRNDAIVHQIASLIVNGSSTLIVSLILGLKEASIFSVYLIVFQGINTVCFIVSNAIYASFGEVIAKNEHEVLKKAFNIYEFIYFIIISIIFSCTFLLIMPFISLYTVNMTDANYNQPILALLFIIVGLANNIRIPALTIVTGAGHFKETKWRAVLEMLLNIFGQFSFGLLFGLNGVLLGCILSFSYRTLDFIIYSHKHILKTNAKDSFIRILLNFISAFVVVFFVSNLNIEINNFFEWIEAGFIYFCLISIFIVLINLIFDKKTFYDCLDVIKSLFGVKETNYE